jgi:hypothetical protein
MRTVLWQVSSQGVLVGVFRARTKPPSWRQAMDAFLANERFTNDAFRVAESGWERPRRELATTLGIVEPWKREVDGGFEVDVWVVPGAS